MFDVMVRKKKKTTKNEWKKVSNEIEKEGIKRIKKVARKINLDF